MIACYVDFERELTLLRSLSMRWRPSVVIYQVTLTCCPIACLVMFIRAVSRGAAERPPGTFRTGLRVIVAAAAATILWGSLLRPAVVLDRGGARRADELPAELAGARPDRVRVVGRGRAAHVVGGRGEVLPHLARHPRGDAVVEGAGRGTAADRPARAARPRCRRRRPAWRPRPPGWAPCRRRSPARPWCVRCANGPCRTLSASALRARPVRSSRPGRRTG